MNAMMEAVQVLAEIESLRKKDRSPGAIKLDPIGSESGKVKLRGVPGGKFKLHTGKNLTPKQLTKNLKTLHDLHRTAADEHRFKAQDAEKGSERHAFHTARAEFHDLKGDTLAAKIHKTAA